MEYTNALPSSTAHRRWVAISAIGAALERKVWLKTFDILYPNFYILLVGPPGAGKGVSLSPLRALFDKFLEDQHVSSSSVTTASLIDELKEAQRFISHTTPYEYNSLFVLSTELSVLLPSWEVSFMSKLTDLWDCVPYGESRRGKNIQIEMKSPQINLLAATTPSSLTSLLPEGAWDQGFMSRTLCIYNGERKKGDLFAPAKTSPELFQALGEDLQSIAGLFGEITFEADAAEAVTAWHEADGHPAPDHPKLLHYCARRTAHLLKLCIIASIDEGSTLSVTLAHYRKALDWLMEAEAAMPDIFRAMSSRTSDFEVIQETWHFIWETYRRSETPIAESRIILFLQARVPSYAVKQILEGMEGAGLLKPQIGSKGVKSFIPVQQKGGK